MLDAQIVGDTVKTVRINPKLQNAIHFHGYIQPRSSSLSMTDSLTFKGFHTVKRLSIKEFLRLTQADAEKYAKVMKEIYDPLIAEQQRIIDEGIGQSRINPKLGYFDPQKMPTEYINENKHDEKRPIHINSHEEEEVLKKYSNKK
ncbi:MAG: hypothetical protein H6Q17_2140 [Bacteroidetes bacterium]|nr:hypothetical protein [Bacteroidota bacterium]